MRRVLVATAVAGLAALPGLCPPARAETAGRSLELQVSQGYDSNPLELNREALPATAEAPRGSFTQLALDARLSHRWTPRAGFFVSARGQGRLHPSDLDDAEIAAGRAEAGLGLVLFARGERRLSAALRGAFGFERATFVDPATGEVYLVGSDPNAQLPVPDRFDVDVAGAHLDLRLRTSRRFLLMLDSSLERQRYTEDYGEVSTLERLDDRTVALRPGLRWQVSERVRLDAALQWSDRLHAGLAALEEDGSAAPGTRRRYRGVALRTALRIEPSAAWSVQVGVTGTDRRDAHAGYYDATGAGAFASAAWAVTETTRLGLHVTQSIYDYERATLDNLPNGDLRGGDILRAAGSVERDLGSHVVLFGEAGSLRSDNRDPLYTYDRFWAHAGVRFKL